jgi:hypothetical protein
MTVAGQLAVSYSYDDADRFTGITQGAATVGMAHDASNRQTSRGARDSQPSAQQALLSQCRHRRDPYGLSCWKDCRGQRYEA